LEHRQPIFNVPAAMLALLAVLIAIHVGRQFLDEETGLWWLIALAFIPARYSGLAGELPGGDLASLTSFVTHQFLHADKIHLLVNSAWLLAFGAVIYRRVGLLRFLAFMIASGIAGALLFLLLHPGLMAPVIGASGAIAGLMGGVMRFLFNAIDGGLGPQLREDPAAIPLMPLKTALSDRRIVASSAVFVALNLLAIVGFGALGTASSIAWEAHLGGYFFGLLAFGLFDVASQRVSLSSTNVE
jgi:membrane associated rhomboid family serine protease